MERAQGAGFLVVENSNRRGPVRAAESAVMQHRGTWHLVLSIWTDRCGLAQVLGLLRHNADGGGSVSVPPTSGAAAATGSGGAGIWRFTGCDWHVIRKWQLEMRSKHSGW